MVRVVIDPDSTVAPFEQVRRQVADLIESGRLGPEERLPTVRQLAEKLDLAVNTVAKAYRQLEMAGLIETRGRHGSFVAGAPTGRRRRAELVVQRMLDQMRALGIGDAETLAIVRRQAEPRR